MPNRVLVLATLPTLCLLAFARAPRERLIVSPDGHYLQYSNGTPFFWLADTGWLLFSKLDRPETERYLDNRRAKGFNVVQVMVVHEAGVKNAYGVPALADRDPARPNATPGSDFHRPGEYDYWDHVDWVIDRANERGIFIALVPAWGSVVKAGQLNESNVRAYAAFLARRYRSKPNILWVVGGDIQGDVRKPVWLEMGRTLRAEDPGRLITFHPFGRNQSSTWFHNEPWLDFNMFQSGHRRYDQDTDSPRRYGEDNWRYVRDDYALKPAKPVVDGEPSYENIPQGLHDTRQPYWTAADCRRYAWWSVFAGAAGHTYGDNAVMQFHKPGDKGSYGARNYWFDAMDDPGAGQMQFLKRLMLSRSYFDRVPDQSLIAGENGAKHDYVVATRGKDYVFAYTCTGKPFRVRMGVIRGARVRAWWYSPRDGSTRGIGTVPNTGERAFVPPGTPGPGNDWVLVLDSDGAKAPAGAASG
jgi:hypothetical protein